MAKKTRLRELYNLSGCPTSWQLFWKGLGLSVSITIELCVAFLCGDEVSIKTIHTHFFYSQIAS